MTKHIRFSLDPNSPPTAPDHSPSVKYGILVEDTVYETGPFSDEPLGASHELSRVRLLPPCWPSKIVCVGRNYRHHAAELGNPVPAEPIIFLKPPSSLVADGDAVTYPPISRHVSYEGELGVVIGRTARNLIPEDAESCIFGYTCVNDVTARDLQKKDGQWTRGKGFDTFCPVGPWIVPRHEVSAGRLRVRTFVNGEKKQDASVEDLLFPVGVIIQFITQFMSLEPGDLIATGTPPGVGSVEPGAKVHVEVDGIGVLRNRIVRG